MYRARALDELCGHHPELMRHALGAAAAAYLLYSPLRETNNGPFGLAGPSGSHALALTATSLVISRDSHRPGEPPRARAIPLASVLAISIGEALTLGWLLVRFVSGRQAVSEVVFFHSTGLEHFRELVRRWIRRLPPVASPRRSGWPWRRALTHSPAYLTSQLAPLLDDGDEVLIANGVEAWGDIRWKAACLSASTIIAVSDRIVTIAESERPRRRGMLVFGVDVTSVPRTAVTSATLAADSPGITTLSLRIEAGHVAEDLTRKLSVRADVASDLRSHLDPPREPEVAAAW